MNFLMLYLLNNLLKKKNKWYEKYVKFSHHKDTTYLDVPLDIKKLEKKNKVQDIFKTKFYRILTSFIRIFKKNNE